MKDIIIIGAGPAGMTAALYAARAGMDVMLLESKIPGGQIIEAAEVENYPAITKIAGWQLAKNLTDQLAAVNVAVTSEAAVSFKLRDGYKTVVTAENEYDTRAVIIANGVKRRKLGVDGEARLSSKGVSYCAVCDGAFFRNQTVAVVGGGNSAIEDAIYLSKLCEKVYLIHRRDEFRGEKQLVDRLKSKENVEILYSSAVVGINGENSVESADVKNLKDDSVANLSLSAVFIAVGLVPDNGMFADILDQTDGYITSNDCTTSQPGIYVAGDTRTKQYRQVVTAAADGAIAASKAAEFVRSN